MKNKKKIGTRPLFSVIVPVYNVEKFIRQCIDSILKTSYKRMEVILVDDGSLDNCPQICDEYEIKDERVVVVHKSNGGLVSARKAGAKIAQGEYIVTVDGDDYVGDNFFENLLNAIQKYSPDVICFGSVHFNSSRDYVHKVGIERGLYTKNDLMEKISPILFENAYGKYFSPTLWTKVIRRELYLKYQLLVDDRIRIGEDFACSRPCLYYADKIYILDKELYFYRLNESSMTKCKKPYEIESPKLIVQYLEKNIDLEINDFREQIFRYIVHNLFNISYTQFYQNKKYKDIKQELNVLLSDEYYRCALKRCRYRSMKGNFALLVLKRRWYFVLKVVSMKR